MTRIKITDLPEDEKVSADEMKKVLGGKGWTPWQIKQTRLPGAKINIGLDNMLEYQD